MNYNSGITHIFTGRNPSTDPYIYLKPGVGESLVIEGSVIGSTDNASYAINSTHANFAISSTNANFAISSTSANFAVSSTRSNTSLSVGFTGTENGISLSTGGSISDALVTGTNKYRGCSVSIFGDEMFIGNPGDTRDSSLGSISFYKKIAGVWTYDSYFIPPRANPSCAVLDCSWGFSVDHKDDLMITTNAPGTELSFAIYKKISNVWTHQDSIPGGYLCNTDGIHCCSWSPNDTDIYINDINAAEVLNTSIPAFTDISICNGEFAAAHPDGSVKIYGCTTGTLSQTYTSTYFPVFGYLCCLTLSRLVSVGLDKRSLVVVDRSSGDYYSSLYFEYDIKNIKLVGNILMVAGSSNLDIFIDDGVFYKYQGNPVFITRSDDTLPYNSGGYWPRVFDFCSTTGTLAYGSPLDSSNSGKVDYQTLVYLEDGISTIYPSITSYLDQILVYTRQSPVIIQGSNKNGINYNTSILKCDSIGSVRLFTDTLQSTSTTNSSSLTSGSLIVAGGIGVSKTIFSNALNTNSATVSNLNTSNITTSTLSVSNNISGLNSYCTCFQSFAITQTIPNISQTNPIRIGSITSNSSTITGSTNGTITVNSAGLYTLSASVYFSTNATGYRDVLFNLSQAWNGLFQISHSFLPVQTQPDYITMSQTLYLSSGTSINLLLFQNSGSSLQGSGNFTVAKICS